MFHLFKRSYNMRFKPTVSAFLGLFLTLLTCLNLTGLGYAQYAKSPGTSPNSILRPQGSVTYRQQVGSAEPLSATLVFANQKSLYYHSRKDISKASLDLKEVAEMRYVKDIDDQEGQCVYKDGERNHLISRVYDINRNILLEEPVPVFNWVISSDTKTLGTYRVQKATTSFRGRQYEAWFAPDIPLPLGPWKLGGLPGLILEAYDSQKLFKFEAISVSLPTQLEMPVCPPTEGERVVGWDAYCTRTKVAAARMIKFMQAKSPGVVVSMSRPGSLEVIE